jgi:predicted O-methyltransferase YrrM
MQFKFLTSMNRRMYDEYGEIMMDSFSQYWPSGELHVYTENEFFPYNNARIVYHDLMQVEGIQPFLEGIKHFPVFNGLIGETINYKYNVNAFCRKVFAQIDAAKDYKGYLFWVDADVKTFRSIPAVKLEEWMRGCFMAVMKRKTWHLCSSFVGWDCSHAFNKGWWEHYANMYNSGSIFMLTQWDDAFVLEKTIEELVGVKDIAEQVNGDGPYNVFDGVFDGYATHDKGPTKHVVRYMHLLEIVKQMQPKRILEIGTWSGARARQMLELSPKSEYHGFDLFEEASDKTDQIEKNVKKHYSVEEVRGRLNGLNATLYKGDSKKTLEDYLKTYGEDSADCVFIDGGHSVETIRSDYSYAKKIVQKDGIIIFDDYYTEMPEEELSQFGAQEILKGEEFYLMPTRDHVKGGGRVQMAVVQC